MTVSPTTPSYTAPALPTATSTSSGRGSALSSDFETFLQMLTAQARYQDPLEPIDSTEYAAQLAQFSMVEQQVQTNDVLGALYDQLSTDNMTGLAGWVGMEVRAVMPAQLDGDPVTISPNPASVSDEVFLVVSDADGEEVQRVSLPVSAEPYQWQGMDDDGDPLPSGVYNFEIESYVDGELILAEPAEVYARIAEAQIQDGGTILILDGGLAIPTSAVTALRNPDAPSDPG